MACSPSLGSSIGIPPGKHAVSISILHSFRRGLPLVYIIKNKRQVRSDSERSASDTSRQYQSGISAKYRHKHTKWNVIDTWRSPYLYIIHCAGDPSVSTACEMVCTAVLKVLNLYVVLFQLSITLLSVLCACARTHTHSHRASNSFLNQVRNSKTFQISGTLQTSFWLSVTEIHKDILEMFLSGVWFPFLPKVKVIACSLLWVV